MLTVVEIPRKVINLLWVATRKTSQNSSVEVRITLSVKVRKYKKSLLYVTLSHPWGSCSSSCSEDRTFH